MTDPITTSKSARESLARGLNALQADPSVPPQLVELASPIAQAMGALHQIERTQQLAPHADVALNHVRGALASLQAANANHPAVTNALEAVATSLSLVHTLSRMANGPAPAAQAQAAQAAPQAQAAPRPQPVPAQQAAPQQPPAQQAAPQAPPQAQPVVSQQGAQRTQAMAQKPVIQQGPQAAAGGGGMVARDPFAAPAGGQHHAPLAAGMHAQASPMGPSASPSMPVPAPPAGTGVQLVNADLGAHSPTNFYKGLAGNDIIDHGGLFVSTYILPKMGAPVRLKVSLPGGYEFEANAVVKWTREDGGGDAPPGFGAQFTQITPEARQLVYRYVRNREPLFHDDF